MEEIDLCWRLHLAGRRIVSVPDSVVFHYGVRAARAAILESASDADGYGVLRIPALAWLVARTVFGRGHPAIDFLLLLAIYLVMSLIISAGVNVVNRRLQVVER